MRREATTSLSNRRKRSEGDICSMDSQEETNSSSLEHQLLDPEQRYSEGVDEDLDSIVNTAAAAATATATDRFAAVTSTESSFPLIAKVQSLCNTVAHALSLISILVVYAWISKLGGLSWKAGKAKLVFNWHPLLMITCFCFMTVASLSFRSSWKPPDRNRTKLLHGMAWSVAALSALVGLLAVFKSHNDSTSGYIANMYSLHSWIGMTVIILYLAQFLVGVRAFGGPLASRRWSQPFRELLLKFHVTSGPLIYLLTGTTILLGIQEKEGFVGCAYKVEAPDLFPIQHLTRIPSACLISHGLGLLVLLTMMCTGIALSDFRKLG